MLDPRADPTASRWLAETSFRLGYNYGTNTGTLLSRREVEATWPDLDAELFLNGLEDGLASDTFRLKRIS